VILAGAVTVAAAIIVFHRLDVSAWFDEAFSYQLATQPWHVLLGQYTWGSESNMLLYYLLLRGWLWITSHLGILPTELVLRAPSTLAAVAAVTMVFLVGLRIAGRIAGLVAAGLYATNFLQMILAQNARAYSLELFLLCLSTYALIEAVDAERGERRWWVVYIASSVLAVYAGLFSVLVIGAQVAWLVFLAAAQRQRLTRRRLVIEAACLGAVGILTAPIILDAVIHGGPVWVPPAHLSDLTGFFLFLGGGHRSYELALLLMAAIGMVAAVVIAVRGTAARRIFNADAGAWRWATLLAAWALIPIGVSFALTRPSLNLHLFFPRYLVVSVPPLCLLAGLGVSSLRWIPLRAAAALGLAVVSWAPLSLYYSVAEVQDFSTPVRWVEAQYQPGDGIVCYPTIQCSIPVGYYFDRYAGPARFDPDSPGLYVWDGHVTLPVTQATLQLYSRSHRTVFFIFGPLSRDPATAQAAQMLEQALASCLRQVAQIDAPATSATVSVYEFAGPLLATCGS
jgi:mannosyltransferase